MLDLAEEFLDWWLPRCINDEARFDRYVAEARMGVQAVEHFIERPLIIQMSRMTASVKKALSGQFGRTYTLYVHNRGSEFR